MEGIVKKWMTSYGFIEVEGMEKDVFAHESDVKSSRALKVGDKVKIRGHTTDFEQVVESMQIEHKPIEEAKPGDKIGLKVKERVRPHDTVYKL